MAKGHRQISSLVRRLVLTLRKQPHPAKARCASARTLNEVRPLASVVSWRRALLVEPNQAASLARAASPWSVATFLTMPGHKRARCSRRKPMQQPTIRRTPRRKTRLRTVSKSMAPGLAKLNFDYSLCPWDPLLIAHLNLEKNPFTQRR